MTIASDAFPSERPPLGERLPHLRTPVPGPASRGWIDRLAVRECPAITARRARRATALGRAKDDPVVWVSARGANVVDVDDNVLVDLTAGFGVALVGHAHPRVVAASRDQVERLPHAMGDAFPDVTRIRLLERLARWTGLERGILGCSGSDAVEAALKTARMATGKDSVLAFHGGYHGLSYGALGVTGYRARHFRGPFAGQLGAHVTHVPFGGPIPDLRRFGAVIVEPVQGRGGMRPPPAGWLADLIREARRAGTVSILDEVFTGFGRTGRRFAFQEVLEDPEPPEGAGAEPLRPDLLCLGKAMGGGAPISVCMGSAGVMDAWGASTGEAIHTQTFLGNPVSCATSLAVLDVVEEQGLVERAATLGRWFAHRLREVPCVAEVRGRGLMLGARLADAAQALAASRHLLRRGYIVLPCGEPPRYLGFTPPLTITRDQLEGACEALASFPEAPSEARSGA